MGFLGHLLTLGRVSNLPTVWTNVVAAYVLNASVGKTLSVMPVLSTFNVWDNSTLGLLLVGASLLYIGGVHSMMQLTINSTLSTTPIARFPPEL